MAIDQLAQSPQIGPLQGLDQNKKSNGTNGATSGLDFKKALDQAKLDSVTSAQPQVGASAGLQPTSSLKFSGHAIERMHSRGITIAPEAMKSIENAVNKAALKGAKDTLVLSGDNALIVNVKNKTVVTVMDREAMKDNVFTNIDSTVMV